MNKIFLGIIIILFGGLVGWYVMKGTKPANVAAPPQNAVVSETPAIALEKSGTTSSGTMETNDLSAAKAMVKFTDTGFSPVAITVKKGTTVTFTNDSSTGMWVASAVHPTHQLLPGFDQLTSSGKGTSYDYVFAKVGTWKYHNHVAPSFTASVIVTE